MRIPESIGWNINTSQAIVSDLEDLRIEEREAASHESALKALLMVYRNVDGHIALATFKNGLRVREGGAATPAPHGPCIAGRGWVAFSERACHVERISICPAGAALCFRKDKAARYEDARLKVEFTDHAGVGAASREHNEATAMIGWESGAAVPDPVLTFVASKRVDIDQHVPVG